MEGVDYSTSRPSGICMYSMGLRFAGRYFGPGSAGKHATATECGGLIASGIAVVALAEGFSNGALDGYNRGHEHALSASLAAANAGMPSDRPIYFEVDFDMTNNQRGAVSEYFYGVRAVIGYERTGIYGGYRTVTWARDFQVAAWFFQTYAWSYGSWMPQNHFEQYSNSRTVCGANVDLCRSKQDDFGQWPPPFIVPPAPPPGQEPTFPGDDWDQAPVIDGQISDITKLASHTDQFGSSLIDFRNLR